MKQLLLFFSLMMILASCVTTSRSVGNDWINLFDGKTTEGWRAFNGDQLPPGWVARDGMLTFDMELADKDYKGSRDIIYGAEEFANFELYVEWKIPKGGNSGIFYHLKEGIEGVAPSVIAPEYQLIDDENYDQLHDLTAYNMSLGHTENPSKLQPLQQTASDYAMYTVDPRKRRLNPVGEWNTTKIVFTPQRVEHWLNGKMVLSFVPWSDDWYARKNNGKWKDAENYGRFKTGYIGFQDHSSPIWFKNVRLRKL